MTPSTHHEIHLDPNPQNTFLGPIKNSTKCTFVSYLKSQTCFLREYGVKNLDPVGSLRRWFLDFIIILVDSLKVFEV